MMATRNSVDGWIDLAALLPSNAAALAAQKDESWLGQLAFETGTGLDALSAFLGGVMAALAVGGGMYLWRDNILAGVAGGVLGVILFGLTLTYLRFRRRRAIRDDRISR